jgi:hypothetical protein
MKVNSQELNRIIREEIQKALHEDAPAPLTAGRCLQVCKSGCSEDDWKCDEACRTTCLPTEWPKSGLARKAARAKAAKVQQKRPLQRARRCPKGKILSKEGDCIVAGVEGAYFVKKGLWSKARCPKCRYMLGTNERGEEIAAIIDPQGREKEYPVKSRQYRQIAKAIAGLKK